MEGDPIRQVNFPGTRTSRVEIRPDPVGRTPFRTSIDPPRGAARPRSTIHGYKGAPGIRIDTRRVRWGSPPRRITPNEQASHVSIPQRRAERAKKGDSALQRRLGGAGHGDRRRPNDALTPVGRLSLRARRTPRPAHTPARSRTLVPASIRPVRTCTVYTSQTRRAWSGEGLSLASTPRRAS